jgi:hypothetical protein
VISSSRFLGVVLLCTPGFCASRQFCAVAATAVTHIAPVTRPRADAEVGGIRCETS